MPPLLSQAGFKKKNNKHKTTQLKVLVIKSFNPDVDPSELGTTGPTV